MFIPHLTDRYAGSIYVGFGHPFGGDLLIGSFGLSCSVSVEVPLAMKMSLGFEDCSRSGANVFVKTCVDVVFTDHDLSQISRRVIVPFASCWSS